MYEVIVSVMEKLINDELFIPGNDWPSYWFKQRCYSRWAANEILQRVRAKKNHNDALSVILEFAQLMENYYDLSTDRDSELIFDTARETAWYILSLLA